jgi:hypothetical protein
MHNRHNKKEHLSRRGRGGVHVPYFFMYRYTIGVWPSDLMDVFIFSSIIHV